MVILDFYADVEKHKGWTSYGERATVRLASEGGIVCFYNMWEYKDVFGYEYLYLTRGGDDNKKYFFWCLCNELKTLPAKKQHGIVKKMGLIDCDFGGEEKYIQDMANMMVTFSVTGTCGVAHKCKKKSACHNICGIPCCTDRIVGFQSQTPVPFKQAFTDMVLWLTVRPAVNVVFSVSDINNPDEREATFLFKDYKITYLCDRDEADRAYQISMRNHPFPSNTPDTE